MARRAAGLGLSVASALMVAVLLVHGPVAPEIGVQMRRIAADPTRWAVAHWMAAAALSLYAVGGLIVVSARSRLTAGLSLTLAWAVLPVSAIWTVMTAVSEATVIAAAAAAGATETFEAWWRFGEGMGNGFAFFALAVAVIAGSEASQPERLTPRWAALAGAAASVASFGGWGAGMWLEIPAGNPIWVASSILMCLWILWFGIGLTRAGRTRSGIA